MKTKIFLCVLFVFYSYNSFAQDFNMRLDFILLIDDQIPENNIFDCFLLIKDSTGTVVKDKISFKYQVGRLMLTSSDYNKLFKASIKSRILMKFTYRTLDTHVIDNQYEGEISPDFINKEYIICRIYNLMPKENRLKYDFRGRKYIFNLTAPDLNTLFYTWPDSINKERRLNQH